MNEPQRAQGCGLEPEIVTVGETIHAAGLVMTTGMKTVFKDTGKLIRKYMDLKARHGLPGLKVPWEYVSLSANFRGTQTWDYYTGHVVSGEGTLPEVFTRFDAPAGTYAVFHVRPKIRLLLGLEIGKTKKAIYVDWLPYSGYAFTGYEYEYNTEAMFRENPAYVDLYVGVRKKDGAEFQ